jgi:hypothetical protein
MREKRRYNSRMAAVLQPAEALAIWNAPREQVLSEAQAVLAERKLYWGSGEVPAAFRRRSHSRHAVSRRASGTTISNTAGLG